MARSKNDPERVLYRCVGAFVKQLSARPGDEVFVRADQVVDADSPEYAARPSDDYFVREPASTLDVQRALRNILPYGIDRAPVA